MSNMDHESEIDLAPALVVARDTVTDGLRSMVEIMQGNRLCVLFDVSTQGSYVPARGVKNNSADEICGLAFALALEEGQHGDSQLEVVNSAISRVVEEYGLHRNAA